MHPATYHQPYVRRPVNGSLYDVLDLILDKGLVIDAYVRVSLVGIELLTVDARVVVASVDTYLRFAEKADRLVLGTEKRDLPSMLGSGSKAQTAMKTLEAGQKAVKAPAQAGEKIGEKAMEAGEKAGEKAGEVGEKAMEAGEKAGEKAGEVGGKAGEKTAEAGENAAHQTREAAESASGAMSGSGKRAASAADTSAGLLRRVRSKLADRLAEDGHAKGPNGRRE